MIPRGDDADEHFAAVRGMMESAFGENSCYVLSVRSYGAVRVTEPL